MRNLIVEISAINPTDKSISVVRMASIFANSKGVQLDGKTWLPVITAEPEFSLSYWSEGRAQPLSISYGQISFELNKGNRAWTKLDFDGCDATMWVGELGAAFASYSRIWTGKTGPLVRQSSREASISLLGQEAILDTPLLKQSYQGTGGLEGPSTMLGKLKPISFGQCTNVAPVLIDPVKFIYQVNAYEPTLINAVYSSALTLGPSKGNAADYTNLATTTLAPGEWATCTNSGLFRLGGDPGSAKITADIGTPDTTAGVARKLVKIAGLLEALIGPSFNAGTRAYSLYKSDDANIGDLVREAAFAGSRLLIFDSTGMAHLAPIVSTKSPGTLSEDGSTLPLVNGDSIVPATPASPSWRVRIGHTPVFATHSANEISPAVATQGADLTAARAAADAAIDRADKAQADASLALTRLDATVADGILDRAEKRLWIARMEAITAERSGLQAEGTAQGLSVTAYLNAFNALSTYLGSLTPLYTDTSADTPIDGTIFKQRFVDYDTSKQNLVNALANKAAQTANYTQVTNRPTNLSGINAAEGAKLTGIEAGATVGGTIGTNIKNPNGTAYVPLTMAEVQAQVDQAKAEINQVVVPLQQDTADLRNEIDAQGQINWELQTDVANLKDKSVVLTNDVGSLAGRSTSLELQMAGTNPSNLRTRITDEIAARTTATDNLATRAQTLEQQMAGTSGSALKTLISDETSGRIAGDQAVANRASILEAGSLANGNYVNANPKFSMWSIATNPPDGWEYWGGNGSFSREARPLAQGGGYRTRILSTGVNQGLFCNSIAISAGWYVVEADASLNSGASWLGSGITVSGSWNLNFATEPDSNGVSGAVGVPADRKFSKLIQLPGGALNFHLMTQWDGFSAPVNKDMTWRFCGIRPASDAEIQAVRATTNVANLSARMQTVETATTDGRFAATSRVQTLESQLALGTDSQLFARIRNEENTRIGETQSLASRSTVLEATSALNALAINPNPDFVVWGNSGAPPDNWSWWDASAGINRVGGVNGRPYAAQFNVPANINSGIQQSLNCAFGSFIIEFTGRSTDWQGAGVLAQFFTDTGSLVEECQVPAAATPDSSSFTSRDGGGGAYTRTFSKYYRTGVNGAIRRIALYTMANWDGFGERSAKQITFDKVSIRPATAAEIAGQTALTTANDAQARVGITEGAITGLKGKTAAFWNVETVAGNNRAQLTVRADANGGAGVDIIGDVRITGSNGNGSTYISPSGISIYYPNGQIGVRLGI